MVRSNIIGETRAVSVSQAKKLFSSEPSLQTVLRWCTSGIRRRSDGARIKLASHMEGGRRFVHPAAVAKFIADCNAGTAPTSDTNDGNASEALVSMGL